MFSYTFFDKAKIWICKRSMGGVRNEAANTRVSRIVISDALSFYRNYKYMVYMVYKYIS